MPILQDDVPTPMEQKGLIMRTLMEQLTEEGAELVLVDGIKVVSDAGLGPGRARPGGPRHPRLGRGLGPGGVGVAGGDLRGADRRGCWPRPERRRPGRRSGMVAPHEHPRRPPIFAGARVGAREGTKVRVGITDYAQDALGRHRVRRPARRRERGRGRRTARRGRVDEVGVGDLRAGRGHHHGGERRARRRGRKRSTRIPTARGGSANWSSRQARTRAASSTRSPTVT